MKYLKALRLLSINVLVFFVLLELALRIFPALIPPTLLRHFNAQIRTPIAQRMNLLNRSDVVFIERDDGGAPHRLFRFSPRTRRKSKTLDDMGFCNAADSDYMKSDTFDIIGVGDSFTFCWAAVEPEETWVSRVATLTGSSSYNLAVPGIGPYEYIQLIKSFGIQKKPAVVVMQIYEGNDLRDSVRHHQYRNSVGKQESDHFLEEEVGQETGSQVSLPHRVYYSIMRSSLSRYSYSFNLVFVGIGRSYKKLFLEDFGESVSEEIDFSYTIKLLDGDFDMNPRNNDIDEVVYAKQLRRGEIDLDVFSGAFRSFMSLAQEHGFLPVVTYVPSAHSTYADRVVFEDSSLAELMTWIHREQVDFLADQGVRLGYHFLDLTPVLQMSSRSDDESRVLYSIRDLHPTSRAHGLVAEELARFLEKIRRESSAPGGRTASEAEHRAD